MQTLLRGWGSIEGFLWLLFLMAGIGVLAGEYQTRQISGCDVVVTNDQQNSVWSPTAVLFHFSEMPTGSVGVARVSLGTEYVLSTTTNAGASLVWWADQSVYFRYGDALKLYSGGGTGVVQIIQKAGE